MRQKWIIVFWKFSELKWRFQISFLENLIYSDWSEWTECSKTCGLGERSQSRACFEESHCSDGYQTETETCNDGCRLDPCPEGKKYLLVLRAVYKWTTNIIIFKDTWIVNYFNLFISCFNTTKNNEFFVRFDVIPVCIVSVFPRPTFQICQFM